MSVILTLIFIVSAFVPCMASDGDIKIMFDGQELFFDAKPTIIAGRTMVPMRPIFVTLGYDVEWNGEERSIKAIRGLDEINMYIDFYTVWSNGNAISTDVPPTIISDRTFVPLRLVSEMSGCAVEWNENERTVYIDSTKTPEPSASPDATPDVSSTPEPSPTPKGIELDVNELKINEGETYDFNPAVKAWLSDKRIVWESSDYTIASITSRGKLSAENDGKCTITAKIGDNYDTCEVEVINVPETPDIEIMGFDTTKLFVKNREYILITIRNLGDYPIEIDGTGAYKYITGAEGIGSSINDLTYDVYTVNMKTEKTVIEPRTYKVITFTKTNEEPTVGQKVKKEDFEETLSFTFTYDGKTYTGEKYKRQAKTAENQNEQKPDFVYH